MVIKMEINNNENTAAVKTDTVNIDTNNTELLDQLNREAYEKTKVPLVIDINLIKTLRYEGRFVEAAELLKTFREGVKKEKDQILKEIKHRDNQIRYNYCKKNKLCKSCHKEPAKDGKAFCHRCAEKHKEYYRKYADKNYVKLKDRVQATNGTTNGTTTKSHSHNGRAKRNN